MKKTIKGFILGVIISTILMSTVMGAGVKKIIEVVFNSVILTVNGEKVEADNILYKGTTYVPLRAIAEILGKDVIWDKTTNTASINDKVPEKQAEIKWEEVKVFEGSSMKFTETFKITSHEWRIIWETEPGEYGDSNFAISTHKPNGSIVDVEANAIGKANDVTYKRGSGDFYLNIISSQPYKIIIEQKENK